MQVNCRKYHETAHIWVPRQPPHSGTLNTRPEFACCESNVIMKEYRLVAWPELPPEFKRTGHRRVLSDMSLRHMSLAQLVEVSGLKKSDLKSLLELLDARGVLDERDSTAPDSFLDSIGRLGWLRRGVPTVQEDH